MGPGVQSRAMGDPGSGPKAKAMELTRGAQSGFPGLSGEHRQEPLTESPEPPSETVVTAGSSGRPVPSVPAPLGPFSLTPSRQPIQYYRPRTPGPSGSYLTPVMVHTPPGKARQRIAAQRPLWHTVACTTRSKCLKLLLTGDHPLVGREGSAGCVLPLAGSHPIRGPHCLPLVQMTSGALFYCKNLKPLPS